MKNKKVLFVTHTANFSKFNRPFMRWLKENGCQVDYASSAEEEVFDCDNSYKIVIDRSPWSLKNIRAIKNLRKLIEDNQYDLVHCHTPMGSVVARLAAKNARRKGITKVMYTAHGFHFYKGAPLINWLLYYTMEKLLSEYLDCLVTINSEDYKNAIKHHFKAKRIEKIDGIGVDLKRFYRALEDEKLSLRNNYKLSSKEVILTCVAELNKNKNEEFLIEAMQKLPDKYHLFLAGTGPLENYLKEKVTEYKLNNRVHFLGYIKNVDELYRMSDILVTASHREGLAVNILEGMASGLSVICSDTRGQRDLIQDDINGYVYPINDMEKFIERIEKIVADKELYKKMSDNNLEAVKKYSVECAIKNMSGIYKDLLNE